MNIVVRALALGVVIAGAAAASLSSSTTQNVASHQASARLPIPVCGPNVPTCPKDPSLQR